MSQSKIEKLHSIAWHLNCARIALDEICSFIPPADPFRMRMYHSMYPSSLLSAKELVFEISGADDKKFKAVWSSTSAIDLSDLVDYIRELRNAVIHRGLDIAAMGEVINHRVCALAPPTISNRNGHKTYNAPARLLVEVFDLSEQIIKPALENLLEPHFNSPENINLTDMDEVRDSIEKSPVIPSWAKLMSREVLDKFYKDAVVASWEQLVSNLKEGFRPHNLVAP